MPIRILGSHFNIRAIVVRMGVTKGYDMAIILPSKMYEKLISMEDKDIVKALEELLSNENTKD